MGQRSGTPPRLGEHPEKDYIVFILVYGIDNISYYIMCTCRAGHCERSCTLRWKLEPRVSFPPGQLSCEAAPLRKPLWCILQRNHWDQWNTPAREARRKNDGLHWCLGGFLGFCLCGLAEWFEWLSGFWRRGPPPFLSPPGYGTVRKNCKIRIPGSLPARGGSPTT